MKVLGLASTFLALLSGCGAPVDEEAIKCACETAASAYQCNMGNTSTLEWSYRDDESCEESSPYPLSMCCAGTIGPTAMFSPAKPPMLLATIDEALSIELAMAAMADMPEALETSAEEPVTRIDCPTECNNEDSFMCQEVSGAAGFDLKQALNNLDAKLANGNTIIPKQDLMNDFNEPSDPCMRSDISFNDGQLSNTGKSCRADISLNVAGATTLKITLIMPPQIFAIRNTSNGIVSFDFSDTDNQMKLMIDGPLHLDYGGEIRALSKTPTFIVMETERGCLKL